MSNAAGPDGFHAKIIKECKFIFSKVFYIIFTKSLHEGKLPDQWKQANVKALYKKGKRTQCQNYRPVSLTSIVCKILEGIVRDNIMSFLESNNLIINNQHGFRVGHYCTIQLLGLLEYFTDYFELGIPYDCIYLDFAKAFDRVPHQRLLTKLNNLGLQGELLNWIKNFLTRMKQRVMVNNTCSEWSEVISRIPQGSVLGPILFIAFINAIVNGIQSKI